MDGEIKIHIWPKDTDILWELERDMAMDVKNPYPTRYGQRHPFGTGNANGCMGEKNLIMDIQIMKNYSHTHLC